MKLTRLEAENFKKLTAIDITFNEGVTEISGPNGSGKSSTLDCIDVCLEGMSVAPPEPIRLGADQSFLRSHFKDDANSGLIITRRFRRGAEGKTISDFAIETPAGARYPSPQAHLDKIISDHMLDPLQFIEMKDKEQFDVLRSFVPGFDFEENGRLHAGAFAKRTEVSRDQKKAQAAADAIDVLDKAPGERVDEAALTAELQSAGERNTEIERRRSNREKAVARVEELRRTAAQRVTDCDSQVAELLQQIEELRAKIETTKAAAGAAIEGMTAEANELQAKLDAAEPLPDTVDAAAITTKLNEARRINRAIEDWETQRARRANHRREANELAAEADALTEKLAVLKQAKQDAIQKAALPVAGLSFGDGFITLNGVRFNQASTAEKLRTAFAISIAKRPKLRLCWIRDASLLDDNSLQIVADLAREYDAQVLLETVRPNSANAIVLEDGHVKGVEPVIKNATAEKALAAPVAASKKQGRKWQGPGSPKENTGDQQ